MIWFTTISILFLMFVVPAILASTLKMIPSGDQPGYNPDQRLSIYGIRNVSQKFISKEKNLTAIGTSIRNPNLKNKKEIIFNIYDENNKLTRTALLNGMNVQDGDFIKFIFNPITDSLNKTYVFNISTPEAGPEETIEVFYGGLASKDVLEYTYDEKSFAGGLPIVTFYKSDSKQQIIKDVFSNWFSRLLLLRSQK